MILNESSSTRRVKPEARRDKEQQCEPEKKATLSFQAAFTNQLLEGSVRNHESIPAYVPKTLPSIFSESSDSSNPDRLPIRIRSQTCHHTLDVFMAVVFVVSAFLAFES